MLKRYHPIISGLRNTANTDIRFVPQTQQRTKPVICRLNKMDERLTTFISTRIRKYYMLF